MAVFVLDKKKQPLMPCSEKQARLRLDRSRAVVMRVHPFTIRLKDRVGGNTLPVRIKLDPGSRTTGVALVREGGDGTEQVLWMAEIAHRGQVIRGRLVQRHSFRRRRRSQLRHHAPRFDNRSRPLGWLAPSLQDAAAVNSIRWALFDALRATGLPVETGTGGRTKWNRQRFGIPKGHALDAACVGAVEVVEGWNRPVLAIKASGRGSYQPTRLTCHGFPRGYLMRKKQVKGFQTGDHVRAVVPAGRKAGIHIGRVAVRATGSFNIQTQTGVIQGISHRHCTLTQRADGYGYCIQSKIAATETEEARTKAA